MRRPFLDNARGVLVLLVVLYHAVYLLNGVGVISNVAIAGIPPLDALLYVCYPWFMVCLFAIAGASARYALERQSGRTFLRAKLRRVLLPSIAGVFLLGWVSGLVTLQYAPGMFGEQPEAIPLPVRYLILCMMGIGALWFLHELFLCDLLLLLVRRIDRRDALGRLGARANLPMLLLLALPIWASAQVLNTPGIEVYRCGIYPLSFLLGYAVLAHEAVQAHLARVAPALLAAALALCAVFTLRHWGENYAAMPVLRELLTNLCAWVGTLAVFACFKRWGDRETRFTRRMRRDGFAVFVLHLPLMTACAWALDRLIHLPGAAIELLLPVCAALLLPPLTALIRRIPPLRRLILGE
ncbi:MAG: acyltransferase family protein [Clostridiales bacterium]|nr:acyltransferase family protein [Clostridiales bacterium]